jgi:cytochrome c
MELVSSTAGSLGLAALAVLALVSGCGPVEQRAPTATVDPADVPAALDPASLAAADLERGELLGLACLACHTFAAGAGHNIGPNLHAVFGAPGASREGFAYSDALRSAGIVWSPAALDRWLADPAGFVRGSSMTFAGYADPQDRRDLIAYLLQQLGSTDAPE